MLGIDPEVVKGLSPCAAGCDKTYLLISQRGTELMIQCGTCHRLVTAPHLNQVVEAWNHEHGKKN